MLEQEDIKNLLVMMQRVDLKGNEALTIAQLQLKLQDMLKKEVEEIKSDKSTKDTKKN